MKLIVHAHKIEMAEENLVNEKEIDISKCYFEFDEEITDDYVKEAYFTSKGKSYKVIIENNECDFANEALEEQGMVEIGVVAYLVENGNEIKRYNPSPIYFNTLLGSLKEAENSAPITPSEMEQFEQKLNNGLAEVENINVEVEKVNRTTYITITNRDGTKESFEIEDGTVDYNFATFEINDNMELVVYASDDMDMEFEVNDEGFLEVLI